MPNRLAFAGAVFAAIAVGDPHMQAAEEGLTIESESPNLAKVHDWAKKQWEQSKHRALGIYTGALGNLDAKLRRRVRDDPDPDDIPNDGGDPRWRHDDRRDTGRHAAMP